MTFDAVLLAKEFLLIHFVPSNCKISPTKGVIILVSVNDDKFAVLVYSDNVDQLEPL